MIAMTLLFVGLGFFMGLSAYLIWTNWMLHRKIRDLNELRDDVMDTLREYDCAIGMSYEDALVHYQRKEQYEACDLILHKIGQRK